MDNYVEILGGELKRFFDTVDSQYNDAEITYAGNRYEVWEVSDELFEHMSNMQEEEFVSLAGEEAWWRWSSGSILGVPNVEYEINGQKLLAWDGRNRDDYFEECEECSDKKKGLCGGSKEDFEKCFGARVYSSLTEYLCEEIGASMAKNVCACAMDLAKYNNMTLGELFTKYEGEEK